MRDLFFSLLKNSKSVRYPSRESNSINIVFLSNLIIKCVPTFRALSPKRIKAALFLFSEVVWRQKKILQVNFPLTLMVYHRKISKFIKKQNAVTYGASIKDSNQVKSAFKNIVSNSLLLVEAKPVKSRITKNITVFQIKLIRRSIYVDRFYTV